MLAQTDDTINPKRTVTLYGQIAPSGSGVWRTYSDGAFSNISSSTDGFRVPNGATLIIVQADFTLFAESRKVVAFEFRSLPMGSASFPLGQYSVRNSTGVPVYTDSASFKLGLIYPAGSLVGVVELGPRPAKFEVTLYGYYR